MLRRRPVGPPPGLPPGPRPAQERPEDLAWEWEFPTPEYWFYVTGRPDVDTPAVAGAVDDLLERRPEWSAYRQAIEGPLGEFSEWFSRQSGRMCAASRWEMTDHGLVTATVIARVYERPPGPVEDELQVMTELCSVQQPQDEYPPSVERVRLAVGSAVRREVVFQPYLGAREHPLRLGINFWAPLDFAPTRTLGITATTANLAVAATLVPEFGSMAEACRIRVRGQA